MSENKSLADQLDDYIAFRDEWGPISKEIREMKAENKRLRELPERILMLLPPRGVSMVDAVNRQILNTVLKEIQATLEGKENERKT